MSLQNYRLFSNLVVEIALSLPCYVEENVDLPGSNKYSNVRSVGSSTSSYWIGHNYFVGGGGGWGGEVCWLNWMLYCPFRRLNFMVILIHSLCCCINRAMFSRFNFAQRGHIRVFNNLFLTPMLRYFVNISNIFSTHMLSYFFQPEPYHWAKHFPVPSTW